MRIKITNASVDRIPYVTEGQKTYWDEILGGFGIRIGMQSKTYIVQHDICRRTCVYTIGRHGVYSADAARKVAKEVLVEISKGINPNDRKRAAAVRGTTLREAADTFFASPKERADTTIEGYHNYLRRYFSSWMDKPLKEISRKFVRDYHLKIGKEHGPSAANGALRTFRAIWNHAMRADETLPVCPTISIDWFKEYRKQMPIPPKELLGWYEEIKQQKNPIRRDINLTMLFTGLRRTDAATIRWQDIDFEQKTLHRPKPKGGVKRAFTVPLTDFVMDIFKQRKEENEIFYPGRQWVFPADSRAGHVMEPKDNSMKWSAHRLRDTYTTAANAAGLSGYDIEVLTNHRPANSTVTAGYINQDIEHLRISQQKITD